jgi:hypothetical protein
MRISPDWPSGTGRPVVVEDLHEAPAGGDADLAGQVLQVGGEADGVEAGLGRAVDDAHVGVRRSRTSRASATGSSEPPVATIRQPWRGEKPGGRMARMARSWARRAADDPGRRHFHQRRQLGHADAAAHRRAQAQAPIAMVNPSIDSTVVSGAQVPWAPAA